MNFEFDNNIPIYIQLVEHLKIYIISGKVSPGDRLPSVRELAMQTKVNPNTMQKALGELENLGLVYTERTSGRFVTDDKALIDKERKNLVKESVKSSLETLINLGYTDEEIIKLIEEILKEGKYE